MRGCLVAARARTGQPGSLIQLDAFIARVGKSAFDFMPGIEPAWTLMSATYGDGWRVPSMSTEELGITDRADAAWGFFNLKPVRMP